METTSNFDPEDWAIFQRSLFHLHSPDIDSERKLYNLMKKSIRKHHPTSKDKNKNFNSRPTEYRDFNKVESTKIDNPCSLIERDPRLKKSSNETIKSEITQNIVAIEKPPYDNLNAHYVPRSSRAGQQIKEPSLDGCYFSKNETVRSISGIEHSISNNMQKKRLAHTPSKDILNKPTKPYMKNISRYNYCQSPVNLKKIRAVLARGDPFPTHLTKICMNNITPDLQREKL